MCKLVSLVSIRLLVMFTKLMMEGSVSGYDDCISDLTGIILWYFYSTITYQDSLVSACIFLCVF